jgi:hypothetical protein
MAAIILTVRPGILLAMDMRILLTGAYLAGSLLLAAAIIAVVRHLWRGESKQATSSDELAHYRALYERGAISEEEFKRLRTVLGGELRQSLDLPAVPAPASPKPADTGIALPEAPPTGENKPPRSDGIRPA